MLNKKVAPTNYNHLLQGRNPMSKLTNTNMEEAVLGALLVEHGPGMVDVLSFLPPSAFQDAKNEAIYRAVLEMWQQSKPIDLHLVVQHLRATNKLTEAGGPAYIAYLTNKVASSAHLKAHKMLLAEYHIRRQLVVGVRKVEAAAFDLAQDPIQMQASAIDVVQNIGTNYFQKKLSSVAEIAQKLAERETKPGLQGVPTGFCSLDLWTNGWGQSSLNIIAARPGMGKTSLMASSALHAASKGKKVGFLTLEMSVEAIAAKLIAQQAGATVQDVKHGNKKAWVHAKDDFTRLPIYIENGASLTIPQLTLLAKALKLQKGIDILFIDYLQLMSVEQRSGLNQAQVIGQISQGLKGLAIQLDSPIVVGCQVNRGLQHRPGKKSPKLEDLRDSGRIEEDADLVLGLYRPEYYGLDEDDDGNPTHNVAEIEILKNREGCLGLTKAHFTPEQSQFSCSCNNCISNH